MDRSFEYKVVAYLDGQLDRREERAFLREVARDPAKRAVLAQHRQLSAALGDRKNPVAVPLKTQQALAEKLPALQNVVPKAAPAAAGATGGAAASMFSGKIAGLVIAGGILVGSIGFVLLSGSATDEADPAATPGNAPAAESAVMSEPHSGASAFRETEGTQSSAQQQVETVPVDGARTAHAAASAASGRTAVDATGPTRSATRDDRVGSTTTEALPDTRRVETTPTTAATRAANTARETDDRHHATRLNHRSIAAPLTASSAANAPVASALPGHAYLIERNALRELFGGRLYAYLETGAAQYDMRGTESTARSITKGVYLAGLRYDFTPSIAGGVEFGQSTFAREGYSVERTPLAPGSGTEIVVVDNALSSESQQWLRAHLLWTINPEQRLRLQADAGSGILLGGDNALLFSVGLSSVYAVSPVLQARAGVHYSGTWLSPSGTPPVIASGSGVIGIIHNARDAGTAYSSAIEFRVGFGVLIW